MVIQLLFTKSSAKTREEWEKQRPIREKVLAILKRQPGFIRLQPLWNLDGSREIAAIVTWATQQDWRLSPKAQLSMNSRRYP